MILEPNKANGCQVYRRYPSQSILGLRVQSLFCSCYLLSMKRQTSIIFLLFLFHSSSCCYSLYYSYIWIYSNIKPFFNNTRHFYYVARFAPKHSGSKWIERVIIIDITLVHTIVKYFNVSKFTNWNDENQLEK